jgi:hypothetical protein
MIHLYTVCWDEADMLGFFFRHYDPWVDRYVIYDDGSTDGSLDILRANPRVEVGSSNEPTPSHSFCRTHGCSSTRGGKAVGRRTGWSLLPSTNIFGSAVGTCKATWPS